MIMKNILIVGGSSGIGLALLDLLAVEHNVFVASRTSEALDGKNCTHIPYDVTSQELDISFLPELHGFVYFQCLNVCHWTSISIARNQGPLSPLVQYLCDTVAINITTSKLSISTCVA